jgi:flagellar hook-associated protein 1
MSNLFSAVELGKNALLSMQEVFQIVGNNMANVNTKGYSRQIAVLESVAPEVLGSRSSGRGVTLADIYAVRSQFVDNQIIDTQQTASKYETIHDILSQVESLFNESSSLGLSDNLTDFFTCWSDVANDPTETASRNSLISSAQTLTANIGSAYQSLVDQQAITNEAIPDIVTEINTKASEIARLNGQIATAENMGNTPNDLIDQRTQLIKDLSEQVGVNVYYDQENNSATVEVAGRTLISYTTAYDVRAQRNAANSNYYDILMEGSTDVVNDDITNGKLAGMLETRDALVPEYERLLDNLSYWLGSSVNAVHSAGYALDGTTTGTDFFTAFTPSFTAGAGTVDSAGTTLTFSDGISDTLHVGNVVQIGAEQRVITSITDSTHAETDTAFTAVAGAAWQVQNNYGAAANLGVNALLIDNPELIAAADTANAEGDNGTALAIAALMDSDTVAGIWTTHEYVNQLLVQIGNDTRSAEYEMDSNADVLTTLQNTRDEISGVSLDEEAANLMKYEKTYQAMAQYLSVINDLTDVLISIGG